MIKRLKSWLPYFAVILGILAITAFSLTDPNIAPFIFKGKPKPDFSFEKLTITQLDDGKILWEITAETATIEKKSNQSNLINIKGKIFQNNVPVLFLQAAKANLTLSGLKVSLQGNPVATFAIQNRDYTLSADTLFLDPDNKFFIGEGNIKVSAKELTLLGQYFKVDLANQIVHISKGSHADLTIVNGLPKN